MSLDLHTVQGFVTGTRALLLDKTQPYRYSDNAILAALNITMLEGRRLRPDLFICRYGVKVPQWDTVSGDEVPIEEQFRLAFEYGVAAHVLLRDEEDVQDARAASFMSAFRAMLVGQQVPPIQGGTPAPAQTGGNQGGTTGKPGQ